MTASSDKHGRVSTTTYDLLGRVVSNTDFDGNTTIDQYDAVGNLLESTTTVNGLSSTVQYTYDSANRLSTLNGAAATVSYAYNGMGDRLQEIVNGSTTTFTMDLNTGLTQALSDGTYTYTYGLGRIAQYDTTAEYFLGDALGSVRQLTDAQGQITLAKAYNPYGEVTQSAGAGQSSYGYTNEYHDGYNDLVYLRARHYAPGMGRFVSRDTWRGNISQPISYNYWVYANGNPIIFTDPSGHCVDQNDAPRRCIVENGDWVWQIARERGLQALDVIAWNKIAYGSDWNESLIHADDVIYLEDPSLAPKIPPTPLRSGLRWNGYVEGSGVTTTLGFFSIEAKGEEIVYDFETLEAATFTYQGDKNVFWVCGLSTNVAGLGQSWYTGFFHFPSRDENNLVGTYSGKAMALSASGGTNFHVFDDTPLGSFALGLGITSNFGLENDGYSHDFYKSGVTISVSGGIGKSIPAVRWPVEISLVYLQYQLKPGTTVKQYYSYEEMARDIVNGTGTESESTGSDLFLLSRAFFADQLRLMYMP